MQSSVSPIIAFVVAVIFFAMLSRLVFADVGTSSNFRAGQSVNDFGGESTSTSFSTISTGGQFVNGESTSSNFTLAAGFEYFDSFTPQSQNWRWYDDENIETPSSALESENVAPIDVENNNTIKLRVSVAEKASIGQEGTKLRLQFSTSSAFTQSSNVVETSACSDTAIWCYANGAGSDNALITTALLSDADACVSSTGDGCGTHNTSGTSVSSFTHTASTTREYEFTIKSSGVGANTTYFFRLVDAVASSTVSTATGHSYPSISTRSGTLSFVISGVPAATSVGGVTTSVDTTSTQVPFGTLPIGSALTAAHHLVVSTNATAGYEVYVYQSQGLLGDQGAEITPIDGTNDSPTAWTSGCSNDYTGCYGYHTDAAVLQGGSTRFAADDTFARFTSDLREVAFNGSPTDNATTTVVYKIEARDLQAAQSYSTNVTYIVVPTF